MATYTMSEPFIYDVNSLITANVTFIGKTGGSLAIPAGTAVGMITASKKYQVYNNNNSDGTETAVGIVLSDVPALAAGEVYNGVIIISGCLIKEKLTGYDSNAKVDLGAREIVLDTNKTLVVF